MIRRVLAAACLTMVVALAARGWAQDSIQSLPGARKQQEIEIIQPSGAQQVQAVDGGAQQEVRKNEIPSPTQRRVSAVGKVAGGVLAAAVALAASAASLLLL